VSFWFDYWRWTLDEYGANLGYYLPYCLLSSLVSSPASEQSLCDVWAAVVQPAGILLVFVIVVDIDVESGELGEWMRGSTLL
jgi:hypothetical protein